MFDHYVKIHGLTGYVSVSGRLNTCRHYKGFKESSHYLLDVIYQAVYECVLARVLCWSVCVCVCSEWETMQTWEVLLNV